MKIADKEVIAFAEEELSGKLLQVVVNQLEGNRQPWNTYPKDDQEIKLNAMRLAIEDAVKGAVYVIAASRRSYLKAGVESVTFKDGVKAVLTLLKTADAHDLADAEGSQVLIVITDAEKFLQGGDKIEAQPDQPSLPLAPKRAADKTPEPQPAAPAKEKPQAAPIPEVHKLKDGTFQIVIGKKKVHYPDSPASFKSAAKAETWLLRHLEEQAASQLSEALVTFAAEGETEGKKADDVRDMDAAYKRAADKYPRDLVEENYAELSAALAAGFEKGIDAPPGT